MIDERRADEIGNVEVDGYNLVTYSFGAGDEVLFCLNGGPGMACDYVRDSHSWLADRGYDPVYGARPLQRVIQKDLVDPIARKLLAGEIEDGSVIAVSAGDGGLEIGKAQVH